MSFNLVKSAQAYYYECRTCSKALKCKTVEDTTALRVVGYCADCQKKMRKPIEMVRRGKHCATREIVRKAILADPKVSREELLKLTGLTGFANVKFHIDKLEEEGTVQWTPDYRPNNQWLIDQRRAKGECALPKLSPARQAELINRVVKKAQEQEAARIQNPSRDVVRTIRRGQGRMMRIRAARIG